VPEKKIIAVPGEGTAMSTRPSRGRTSFPRVKGAIPSSATPSARPEVQETSDHVASTGGMVKILRGQPPGRKWTILTEREMGYRLRRLYPDQDVHVRDDAVCRDMKKTTLRDLLLSLEREQYEVILPGETMERARNAIRRMLEAGR